MSTTKPLFQLARGSFYAAAFFGVAGMTGCISDTDCGVCDPDNLVLESISGVNYAQKKVHLLQGVDSGKYFIKDLGACIDTPEAQEAPRGAEEWCKISPLVSWQGLEFVFNNLLDPTSVELVRKDPSNPNLFEIYDWKNQIAHIEGPIARFNGDYYEQPGDEAPDLMLRSVNLSCIDNLREMGMEFDHTVLDENPEICNQFHTVNTPDGRQYPRKMWFGASADEPAKTHSYSGETDWRRSSCTAPPDGPDTCCTVCDYELSVNVAKYGVESEGGAARTPSNAITCDPNGNVYEECAGFVTEVDRTHETRRYRYDFGGVTEVWRLPKYDKVRETHPDERPAGVEPDGKPCQSDADCDEALGGNDGAVCIGTTAEGVSCTPETDGCMDRHCKAEWFVTCKDDSANTGLTVCVDKRFKDRGAGACYYAPDASFTSCELDGSCTTWPAGTRLARCDVGDPPDNQLSAQECCQESLGGGAMCDPLFQPSVRPIPRFDRDQTLPEENRSCYCGNPDNQHEACRAQIEQFCTAPWGNLERHDGTSNEGVYTTRFVSKSGGVLYDPALKGILYLIGDRGDQPRAKVEDCANQNSLIGTRNIQDGWMMHNNSFFDNYENFDRALCSGSEYTVVFAEEGQHVVDKVGNVLDEDKLTYSFETPEFHVVPGTGFPTDNLRIGACDDFEIKVSNRYDLDPNNLKKVQLIQLERLDGMDDDGIDCSESSADECFAEQFVVAGGSSCTEDPEEVVPCTSMDDDACVPPCLTVDTALQREGQIRAVIDSVRFGVQLYAYNKDDPSANVDEFGRDVSGRYRMVVPGLEDVERFEDLDLSNPSDLAAYNAAFHDACGMPLVTEGGQGYTDFYYDFTIDPPKCKEDQDRDSVQLSCDNARNHYNPDQNDQDLDGAGDVIDLCVLTFGTSTTADSDKDGVGNECDTCRQTADKYNLEMAMVADPRMWVRNNPMQGDWDNDGIGDVCDNCVKQANCSVFGDEDGLVPHTVGTAVPYDAPAVCQTDVDSNMIGDACWDADNLVGTEAMGAAGPIGFEPTDDFDQDGINNLEDVCPRQPVEPVTCTVDADCETGSCAATAANDGMQYCNHLDSDGDGVGNICDTCPYSENPMQVTDTGMQLDDEDGDFVGTACETNSACHIRKDPRPYAFMEVAVDGQCCSYTYPGDGFYVMGEDGEWECEGLCDPDGFPIQTDCADGNEAVPGEDTPDGTKCRKLPPAVANLPGMVDLPPGCQEALDAAGLCAARGVEDPDCPFEMSNRRLTLTDYPDEDELWSKMCFLPQWDQDFDGIGDACDLCTYAFDPFNEPYVDENTGKLWDDTGRFCQGRYAPDELCKADDEGEGETGTTGTTGG